MICFLSQNRGNNSLKFGTCLKNIQNLSLGCCVVDSVVLDFDAVMPIVRKWIKGPMWLHFLVGVSYQLRI